MYSMKAGLGPLFYYAALSRSLAYFRSTLFRATVELETFQLDGGC